MLPYADAPPWRDNRRLARLAGAVFVGTALLGAITSEVVAEAAIRRAADDGGVRYTPGAGFSTPTSGLVSLVNLVGLVAVMVTTWRLVAAHRALGRPDSRWGTGWAVAGRVIPLASAVLPALQLGELWRGSAPGTPHGDPLWRTGRTSRAVGALLVTSVLSTVLGVVLVIHLFVTSVDALLTTRTGDPGRARTFERELARAMESGRPWRIVGGVLGVAVALLTAWLLIRIADRQQQLVDADPALPRAPQAGLWPMPAPMPGTAAPIVAAPPGWYPDPWGRFAFRWWDGGRWAAAVATGGVSAHDPAPVTPAIAPAPWGPPGPPG